MKKTHSMSQFMPLILATAFALFLLYNTLSSTEFPRILYIPPDSLHWAHFDSLNPTAVWNYSLEGYEDLDTYLDYLGDTDIKAVLRPYGDYGIEKYSEAQYHHYEAERDYDEAQGMLNQDNPEGFYFFWHGGSADTVRGEAVVTPPPDNVPAWKCETASDDAGIMLYGPGETTKGQDTLLNLREQSDWPEYNSSRDFKAIIRVMADAQGLADNDTIFSFSVWFDDGGTSDSLMVKEYFTKSSFGGTFYNDWKNFEVDYVAPDNSSLRGYFTILYQLEWYDKCDFWVDWVEFMDRDRAYYLFYHDEEGYYTFRDSLVNDIIIPECQAIETAHGNVLMGWHQSDEPIRSAFQAHGVVNEYLKQHKNPPATIFSCK